MIPTHRLTRSGLELSELGLGCATLAFDPSPEGIITARKVLAEAVKAGIAYFDTAPFYGRGLSERLVGDALRRLDGAVISTKAGRLLTPDADAPTHMPFRVQFDYTYDGIMRSFEHSLQRLGLPRIDILLCHDLGRHTHKNAAPTQFTAFFDGGGYRAMEELRRSGDIRAIGLGVNEVEVCQAALKHGVFDLFLLAGRHTLLERDGAQELFEACAKVETDIVIGGPFNSGLLVGGQTYNYRSIPEDVAARHRTLVAFCARHNVPIGAAALQYPLRHPQVRSVIPGPATVTELQQNLDWAKTPIPDAFWAELETI
ncbi:aldo/keto reductase [Thalassobius sp. Cn5-15]|uniref:aldo/keto reductase n=1 Tax=Thalassobius sp. Cn5-15 TaxID=2917763 RepID=UPI001EF1B9C7|nr:aldo/keto reductase [Thalassobius sp. Cn5-15]MCG7495042.1 aldo/keto reductase [Thalassobius sp. Cn5-15]